MHACIRRRKSRASSADTASRHARARASAAARYGTHNMPWRPWPAQCGACPIGSQKLAEFCAAPEAAALRGAWLAKCTKPSPVNGRLLVPSREPPLPECEGRPPCRLALSQSRQWRVIASIFERIGTTNHEYVEFGFSSHHQCAGTGPNTCALWLANWTGLLMDGKNHNPSINLQRHFLDSRNIVSLLTRHRVDRSVDYLSIDMDSTDVWILDAILGGGYRPRLISVEYNPNYAWSSPPIAFPDTRAWNTTYKAWPGFRSCYFGSSARAIDLVAKAYGYRLVAFDRPLDVFFVRGDLQHLMPPFDPSSVPAEPMHGAMSCGEAAELVDMNVYRRERHERRMPLPASARAARDAAWAHFRQGADRDVRCFQKGPRCAAGMVADSSVRELE